MAETEKVDVHLYNGEVTIVFYPNSHIYKKDKKNVPSVSAISWIVDKSPQLQWWSANIAKEYLLELIKNNNTEESLEADYVITKEDIKTACFLYNVKKEEAATTGKIVHDWAEKYAKGVVLEQPEHDQQAKNWILAFLKWKTDYKVEFEVVEKMVYSKKHNYVWRFDVIVKIDGKRYLADYKTSNKFNPTETRLQTAWYVNAYFEETGDKLDGRIVLRFAKDTGEFYVHWLDEWDTVPMLEYIQVGDNQYSEDLDAFFAALKLKQRHMIYEKQREK